MVDAQIEYSALLRNPSEVELPCRTERHTFMELKHVFFYSWSTPVLRTHSGSEGG